MLPSKSQPDYGWLFAFLRYQNLDYELSRSLKGLLGRFSLPLATLQADDSLLRASDARVQAQTESARAAVAAFRALGGGWSPRESEVVAVQ